MDRKEATEALTQFTWERQPAAERLVRELVDELLHANSATAAFAARLKSETGTRFIDWIDHIIPRFSPELEQRLIAAGYERFTEEHEYVWRQQKGMFPPVVQRDDHAPQIAIKVES